MRKKQNKILLPIILISVITMISVVVLFSYGIEDPFGFVTETQVWKLSLGVGHTVTCKVNSELILKNVDGTTYNAGSQSLSKIFIFQDILNRQTAQKISTFNQNLRIYCDPIKTSTETTVTNEQLYIVGGAIENKIVAYNSVGSEVLIKTDTAGISTVLSTINVAGKTQSIPSTFVNAIDIDNKLDVGDGDYQAWVKVKTTGCVLFKNNYGQSFNICIPVDGLNMGYLARVVKPLPLGTTAPLGTTVLIQSVTPNSIDFGKNVRYVVTVIGQLDNWTPSEGYPIMKMKNSASTIISTLPMTTYSNIDGDKYTEFKLTYVFNIDTFKTGAYTFEMTSALGSDGTPIRKSGGYAITSVRGFIAENTSTTVSNTPPTTCAAPKILVNGVCVEPTVTPTGDIVAGKLQFLFKSTYAGKETVGTVPIRFVDSLFKVTAKPLAIIGTESTLGTFFNEKVDVLIKFDSPFTALNIIQPINIKNTGIVTVGSVTLPIPESELKPVILNQKDANGFIHLSQFTLNGDVIQKILCAPATTGICRVPLTNQTNPIVITVDVTGDFVMVDSTGKRYNGFIKNAKFVDNLIYVSAGTTGTEPDCRGLSGEALIQCTGGKPPECGTAGCVYPDEEPNVIENIICAFTGTCPESNVSSSGTVGGCIDDYLCKERLEQKESETNNLQFPQLYLTQETIQLLFILGIILVVIIIIVVIIMGFRRR